VRDLAERWATFALANLLWCLLAVPVITIPAATAGLFAVMMHRVRGQPPELFATFFGAMRGLWLKATIVGVLDVLAVGFIAVNLFIFRLMSTLDVIAFLARSVTLFVALAVLLVNLYVWPLMVVTELSVRQLIETALVLVFAHPLRSIGVLVLTAIPVVVSLLLPRAVILFVTGSACVSIINWGTWPIIRRYEGELIEARP